jgi:sirohydrochlorin cobaltochelatase
MSTLRTVALLLVLIAPSRAFAEGAGILLLAHGGRAEWNAHVLALAEKVDRTRPTEVAFGMATRSNIQAAVDRLAGRGVTEIVAVPLFVSSWSSIITSTEYLLGLRPEAPPELAMYAKMDHSSPHASGSHSSHAVPDGRTAALATTPIVSPMPVRRMTSALNAHPIVAEILTTRARSVSRLPAEEAVVIVAHGPVSDENNEKWLADMRALAHVVASSEPFAAVDCVTLRDDAGKPVRDRSTAELRELVSRRLADGRRVLIVPLLLSYGGIEKGLEARLTGLPYTTTPSALMPDDRLVTWVLEMVSQSAAAER